MHFDVKVTPRGSQDNEFQQCESHLGPGSCSLAAELCWRLQGHLSSAFPPCHSLFSPWDATSQQREREVPRRERGLCSAGSERQAGDLWERQGVLWGGDKWKIGKGTCSAIAASFT